MDNQDDKLLGSEAVMARIPPHPCKPNTLRRMVAEGRHPKPTVRGKRNYWSERLIADYQDGLLLTGSQQGATEYAEGRACARVDARRAAMHVVAA